MPESSPPPKPSKKSVFLARLTSTLVLWAIVVVGLVLNLNWLFLALIGILGFLALLECLTMFGVEKDRRHQVWTILLSAGYLGAVSWHCLSNSGPIRSEFLHLDVFFTVLLFFGLFTVTLSRELDGEATLKRLLGSFFSFFYCLVLFAFLIKVLYLPEANGVFYALYLLAVTKFTDMGAYLVGSMIGKHKMIPHISPGKTWQGFGGGFLGAYAASALIYFPFQEKLALLNLTHVLVLPALLGITTIVGDLAESIVKRCLNVKDSGKMLPGIGGALDLIDSLCFTAPVLYLYMKVVIGVGA